MVDRRAVGLEFHRAHERVGLERGAQHEVAIDVFPGRAQIERPRRRHNRVRRPELPPLGPGRRLRQVGGIALGLAPLDPSLNGVDLIVAQPPLAEDRILPALGQPRRHVPLGRFLGNLPGVLDGVGVGQERERRHFARAMAWGAIREQDRRDVLVERDRQRNDERRQPAAAAAASSNATATRWDTHQLLNSCPSCKKDSERRRGEMVTPARSRSRAAGCRCRPRS